MHLEQIDQARLGTTREVLWNEVLAAERTVEQAISRLAGAWNSFATFHESEPPEGISAFAAVSQHEAIQTVLREADMPLTVKQVTKALQVGGFPFRSKAPIYSVYQALQQNRKGLYVKHGAGSKVAFGLKEWLGREDGK